MWMRVGPTVNAETVQVFAAPIEHQLENLMELGDAGFARDQQTPPDQRTHAIEHDPQLIKFSHVGRLPNPVRKSRSPPRNLPLSQVTTTTEKFRRGGRGIIEAPPTPRALWDNGGPVRPNLTAQTKVVLRFDWDPVPTRGCDTKYAFPMLPRISRVS